MARSTAGGQAGVSRSLGCTQWVHAEKTCLRPARPTHRCPRPALHAPLTSGRGTQTSPSAQLWDALVDGSMGHSMPTRPGAVRFSAAATLQQGERGGRRGMPGLRATCAHTLRHGCKHTRCADHTAACCMRPRRQPAYLSGWGSGRAMPSVPGEEHRSQSPACVGGGQGQGQRQGMEMSSRSQAQDLEEKPIRQSLPDCCPAPCQGSPQPPRMPPWRPPCLPPHPPSPAWGRCRRCRCCRCT